MKRQAFLLAAAMLQHSGQNVSRSVKLKISMPRSRATRTLLRGPGYLSYRSRTCTDGHETPSRDEPPNAVLNSLSSPDAQRGYRHTCASALSAGAPVKRRTVGCSAQILLPVSVASRASKRLGVRLGNWLRRGSHRREDLGQSPNIGRRQDLTSLNRSLHQREVRFGPRLNDRRVCCVCQCRFLREQRSKPGHDFELAGYRDRLIALRACNTVNDQIRLRRPTPVDGRLPGSSSRGHNIHRPARDAHLRENGMSG